MAAFQPVPNKTTLLLFVMCLSSAVRAQNITAHCGQSVTLPCLGPRNSCLIAVEWSRPDRENYIFLNRDGHTEDFGQEPSYVNRVKLKDNEMKDGDMSLILRNVTVGDTGTYECRCYNSTFRERKHFIRNKAIGIVHLSVRALGLKAGNFGAGGNKNGGNAETNIKLALGLEFSLLSLGLLVL